MAQARIMVVEDEGILAMDIQSKLESNGYQVPALATSGEEAVEQAAEVRPDLILMDIRLAGAMDGVEAAKLVRDRLNIPVVYLTANSDDATLQRAKMTGPFGYLLKPFSAKELYTTIEIALYKSEMEAELRSANESLQSEMNQRQQGEEERRQLERSLIQSERMATIGTAAAGIVHNLKGPLQFIMGWGEILQARHAGLTEIDEILSAVGQMNQMIEDILAKSRQNKATEPLDLNALLGRELDFLQADEVFKHAIEKDIRLAADLPPIESVYSDLSQVFGNLLRNAVDAMHGRKTKRLSVSTTFDAEYITVAVTDTGCGIPESIIAQIFDPFFTTKSSEEMSSGSAGMGLGLYTVKLFLEPHRGTVEIESTVEVGTTFRVRFQI
jgi:signal transduction histidine kinase